MHSAVQVWEPPFGSNDEFNRICELIKRMDQEGKYIWREDGLSEGNRLPKVSEAVEACANETADNTNYPTGLKSGWVSHVPLQELFEKVLKVGVRPIQCGKKQSSHHQACDIEHHIQAG